MAMHEHDAQLSDELFALGGEAFDRAFRRLVEVGEDALRPFALLERTDGTIIEHEVSEDAETLAPLHEWVFEQAGDAARYALAFLTDVETEDGADVAAVGIEAAEGDEHTAFIIVAPYRWKDEAAADGTTLEVIDEPQIVGHSHTALHSHGHDHEAEAEVSEELYALLVDGVERAVAARSAGTGTTFAVLGFSEGEPTIVEASDQTGLEALEQAIRDSTGVSRYAIVSDSSLFAQELPAHAFRLQVGELGVDYGLVLLQPYELAGDAVQVIGELEFVDRVGQLLPD